MISAPLSVPAAGRLAVAAEPTAVVRYDMPCRVMVRITMAGTGTDVSHDPQGGCMDAEPSNRGWTDYLPPRRYGVYCCCIALTIISLIGLLFSLWWLVPLVVFAALAALGTWDVVQTRHTVSSNYPVMAHFRYQMESIGPEIRQY